MTRTWGAAPASSSPLSTTHPEFPLLYDLISIGMGPLFLLVVGGDKHDERASADGDAFLIAEPRQVTIEDVLRGRHGGVDGHTPRRADPGRWQHERQRLPVHVHGNVDVLIGLGNVLAAQSIGERAAGAREIGLVRLSAVEPEVGIATPDHV